MSDLPYICEVTQSDFQSVVLENSMRLPVLVDFWAAWCQPCQMLMPMLKKLAEEYQGAFLLAKVNADEEQALAADFGVRSLPTVKVFRNGQVVQDLVGVQPESVYRQVLESYQEKPSDRLLAQAHAAWEQGAQEQALELLREAHSLEPDSLEVKIQLTERLLAADELEAAGEILNSMPLEVRTQEPVSGLLALLDFLDMSRNAPATRVLQSTLQANPDDCAIRRQLAARQVVEGDYESALEQFLEILRRDRKFGDEAGRKGLVAIFDILGGYNPLVATYRRRMAALLN